MELNQTFAGNFAHTHPAVAIQTFHTVEVTVGSDQWAPHAHPEAHNPSIHTGSCQTRPSGQLRPRQDWGTMECHRHGSKSTQAGPSCSWQCYPVAVGLQSLCSPCMSSVQTSLDPNQTSALAGHFPEGQCCQAAISRWHDRSSPRNLSCCTQKSNFSTVWLPRRWCITSI